MAMQRAPQAAGSGRHADAQVAVDEATRGFRLSRRAIALLAVLGLMLLYYGAVFLVYGGESERQVELAGAPATASLSDNRVDLALQVTDLDPSQRVMTMDVQPIPVGDLATRAGGEFAEDAVLRITSPRRPPLTFDLDADEVIDAVSVPLSLTTGAYSYPFDRPDAQARFELVDKESGSPVPINLMLTNAANDWRLSGATSTSGDAVLLETEAKRDLLVSSLAIFYLFAIGLTAIISVAVIGASLTDGEVTFSEVIWLGAMLVAIPAIRNEMPGAPAIGTAVDVFVFFPAVGIIALTLLAATVLLAVSKHFGEGPALEEDD